VIQFAENVRYLGVSFKVGNKLKFNLEFCKKKFYASINGILNKIGNKPELVIPLCSSFCLPLLLFASESMDLNSSEKSQLSWPFSRLFVKLFHVTDSTTIKQCQFYMHCLPTADLINLRTLNFLASLTTCSNLILSSLYFWFAIDSYDNLISSYNMSICDRSHKDLIWNNFHHSLP